MRSRNIKKQVWMNREEAKVLRNKSKKVGLTESELFRLLILGFEPKEKPDGEFYEVMRELRAIGNNLNQIAHKVNATGNIESNLYNKEAKKWNDFINKIRDKYLLPENSKNEKY